VLLRGGDQQNTVARLKSKDLPPPKILGWLRHCLPSTKAATNIADQTGRIM